MKRSTVSDCFKKNFQHIDGSLNCLDSVPKDVTLNPNHHIITEYYSIDDEELFPDYHQHKTEKSGWVGCGAVAWAMIFGYFNRRAYAKPDVYGTGSQNLFIPPYQANNVEAECRAPRHLNENAVLFSEMLSRILGTYNVLGKGVTPPHKMDKIQFFYHENQRSGKPRVVTHSNGVWSSIGNINDNFRLKAIQYLKRKWPVLVGIRWKNCRSGMHYAVATRYREILEVQENKASSKCFRKNKYKLTKKREFYLHLGWQNKKQRPIFAWYPAEIFFAAVATY